MDNNGLFGFGGEMSAVQKTRSDIRQLEQELGIVPKSACEVNEDSTNDAVQQQDDRMYYAALLQLKEQRMINQKLLAQCQQMNMQNFIYTNHIRDIKLGVWYLLAIVALPVAFAIFWAFVQVL